MQRTRFFIDDVAGHEINAAAGELMLATAHGRVRGLFDPHAWMRQALGRAQRLPQVIRFRRNGYRVFRPIRVCCNGHGYPRVFVVGGIPNAALK